MEKRQELSERAGCGSKHKRTTMLAVDVHTQKMEWWALRFCQFELKGIVEKSRLNNQ